MRARQIRVGGRFSIWNVLRKLFSRRASYRWLSQLIAERLRHSRNERNRNLLIHFDHSQLKLWIKKIFMISRESQNCKWWTADKMILNFSKKNLYHKSERTLKILSIDSNKKWSYYYQSRGFLKFFQIYDTDFSQKNSKSFCLQFIIYNFETLSIRNESFIF